MFVIAFANPKGGSGKTTSAMLLAELITVSGGRVSVLDFDPNANIRSWAQSREADGKDVPFAVHARPQAEDTVELVDSLAGDADYLIVDLDGSRDQIVTFALSRTDLCVIPLDGSAMEARQAAQAVRLVQTTGNMIRHEIKTGTQELDPGDGRSERRAEGPACTNCCRRMWKGFWRRSAAHGARWSLSRCVYC